MHAFMRELIREVLAETIRKVDGKYAVYPKGGGKRLGTHSSRKAAERQLTAIHLNKETKDIVPGGLAKGMSIEDLAKKHNLSVKQTSDLLKVGTQVELEHTTSLEAAREIAMDHIYEDPYYYEKLAKIEEKSLRSWFDEKWVRIDTQGNITGACGTMKNKQRPSRCLPKAKAQSLTKAQRAATARKKKAGKGQFVPNTKKAKVTSEELFETFFAILESDYTPTNKDLWSRAIAAAKRKFTKYPSAYVNAWASKWYKGKGGGWRKKKKK